MELNLKDEADAAEDAIISKTRRGGYVNLFICVCVCLYVCVFVCVSVPRVFAHLFWFISVFFVDIPHLRRRLDLKIFGSPDMPVFPATLLSDRDSVYSRERNPVSKFGDSRENCLICTGTCVKICWKFWHS